MPLGVGKKLSELKRETKRVFKGAGFPIKDVHNNVIELKDGTFKAVLKITQPINSGLMSEKELKRSVQAIQRSLNGFRIGDNNQILISTERMDIRKYLRHLDELYDQAENVFVRDRVEAKREFLQEKSKVVRSILTFYIVLSSRSKRLERARDELEKAESKVKTALSRGRMKFARLEGDELMKTLYDKFNPTTSEKVPYRPGMDVWNLRPSGISDRRDCMEMDRMKYRFLYFTDFPERVGKRWLVDLLTSGLNMDLSITLVAGDKSEVVKSTDESIREIRMKLRNKGKLDESEKIDLETDEESLRQMLQDLKGSTEKLFQTSFVLAIRERNLEELNEAVGEAVGTLGVAGIDAREIYFALTGPRHDLLFYTVPIAYQNKDFQRRIYWPFSAKTLAGMLPFDSTELNWNKGILKGFNANDMIITYDRWDRDHFFNGNEIILGTSGAGKSYYLRLDIWREANFGKANRINVLDVEGEYLNIPGANVIDFHLGSRHTTNPFHIRSTVVDSDSEKLDGKVDVGGYLRQKIDRLVFFFGWIAPGLEEDTYLKAILTEAIERTYRRVGLTYDGYVLLDSKKLKPEIAEHYNDLERRGMIPHLPPIFPTLSDLVEELGELENEYGEQVEKDIGMLLMALKPYTTGAYSSLFNGQTNWDLDHKINVLNISAVTPNIQSPLMDLMVAELWDEVKKDRDEKIVTYVDEAHKIANKRKPQTLEFLADAAKRFRKYSACLVTATQNVGDFMAVEEFGRALLNNSWFKTFFMMFDDDVQALSFMNFNEPELELLKADDEVDEERKGRGLHMVGRKRVVMQVEASMDEKKMLGLPIQSA
ncbi:VirB4 family type IV secretion system protein [Salinithrix halophila]|uniref:VirB4 family type IV secretion system protein n=1 Tax=Salinithrix halophila TaxID=1485204 RepID=A0ABV8J8Y7_9BACL